MASTSFFDVLSSTPEQKKKKPATPPPSAKEKKTSSPKPPVEDTPHLRALREAFEAKEKELMKENEEASRKAKMQIRYPTIINLSELLEGADPELKLQILGFLLEEAVETPNGAQFVARTLVKTKPGCKAICNVVGIDPKFLDEPTGD